MKETSEPFDSARSWALASDEREKSWRRTAWIVAAGAALIAVVEAIALVVLMPLKSTETVMLLVDRTTGYVQRIDPSKAETIRADEALLQSLLAQYVVAREGFDRVTVNGSYRRTALWSSGSARNTYLAQMAPGKGGGPFNIYRPGDVVGVEVKSVSPVGPDTAFVRFDTTLSTQSGRVVDLGSWIATIEYTFSNAPMSFDDRLINPLGFQVVSYRRNAERPTERVTSSSPPLTSDANRPSAEQRR